MTKVTSKICERYVDYYATFTTLNRKGEYDKAYNLIKVLDVLEEVLMNVCGVSHDKMAELRYMASKKA